MLQDLQRFQYQRILYLVYHPANLVFYSQISLSIVHPCSLSILLPTLQIVFLALCIYIFCAMLFSTLLSKQLSAPAVNLHAKMATVYSRSTNVIERMTVVTTVMKLAVVCTFMHAMLFVIYKIIFNADDNFFKCDLISTHFHLTLSVCYAGDIRLTGTGSNVSRGNVELCIVNTFNAICGNVWSSNDAKVVCRQLGFNSSKFTTYKVLVSTEVNTCNAYK